MTALTLITLVSLLVIIPSNYHNVFVSNTIINTGMHSESFLEQDFSSQSVIGFVHPDSSFNAIASLIRSANVSIDIMVYEFWSLDIFNLINETIREKNVKVRVLLEGDVYGASGDSYNRWMAYQLYKLALDGYDVTVRLNNDSYYVHAKLIIVDSSTVFVASENFVPTAYPPNPKSIEKISYSLGSRGWGVIVHNSTIARVFLNVFNDEFSRAVDYNPDTDGTGEEPPNKEVISYSAPFLNRFVSDDSAVVQAVLSPENSTDILLDLINKAQHFILLQLAYISSGSDSVDSLLNALRAARDRDVTVQIILEDNHPFDDDYNDIVDDLISWGFYVVPAFYSGSAPLFCHNKGIIVDDLYVFVGSINWSGSALTWNRETGVLIRSQKIAKFYKEVYAWDWNASTDNPFDSDKDGLSNAYEIDHDLDPSNPDTDNDGLTDYEEVMVYNTDPKDPTSPGVVVLSPKNYSYIPSMSVQLEWIVRTNVSRYFIYLNSSLVDIISENITSFQLTGLEDESWYTLDFITELSSGVNISFTIIFAVDTKPPVLRILNPNNNSYVLEGSVTIKWSVQDFSPCTFNVFINSSLVAWTTHSSVSVNLGLGDYIIEISASDSAGNIGLKRILVYVREAPRIIILSPTNFTYINTSDIEIAWDVQGDFQISQFGILLNGSIVDVVPSDVRNYTIGINTDSVYNVTIIGYGSEDAIVAKAFLIFIRDATPPNVSIIYPSNHSVLLPGTVQIKWTAQDSSPVTFVLKVNGKVEYSGTAIRYTITLTSGDYAIELTAIDAAGNKATVTIYITVKQEDYLSRNTLIAIFISVLVVLIILAMILKKR